MANDKCFLVYLASNASGLDLERYEVQRFMARFGMVNVGFACREDAGPYDWNVVRTQIERADLFILLLGDEYGPMAPTGISYLHREFVHAKTLNKPVLSFIKNSLPAKNLSEDQRRLEGFQRIVMQQSQHKIWHLRDELLSHIRISLPAIVPSLGAGWVHQETAKAALSKQVQSVAQPAANGVEPLTARERQQRARELVNLQVTAKVYRGGNLSLEEVQLPARLDQLLVMLDALLKQGASVDRLRAQVEQMIAPTIKSQLLQRHAMAHAVDDIRISRNQFQQLLSNWQELGFISSRGEGSRALWQIRA